MRISFWPCVSALLHHNPRESQEAVSFSFLQESATEQKEPLETVAQATQLAGEFLSRVEARPPDAGTPVQPTNASATPQLAAVQEDRDPRSRPERVTADARIDGLLALSDKVLEGTTELLADALPAHGNSSDAEVEKLASHSGKLEKLFHVLGAELQEEEQQMKGEEPQVHASGGLEAKLGPGADLGPLLAGAPLVHTEPQPSSFDQADIGEEDPPAEPAAKGFLARRKQAPRQLAGPELGVLVVSGCAIAGLCVLIMCPAKSEEAAPVTGHRKFKLSDVKQDPKAWRSCGPLTMKLKPERPERKGRVEQAPREQPKAKSSQPYDMKHHTQAQKPEAEAAPAEKKDEPQGQTSYVVRILKVRVEDVQSTAPLAWQVRLADDEKRPSRFLRTRCWDAPMDGLDLDMDDPAKTLSFSLLANGQVLEPAEELGRADVAASALLAEARRASGKAQGSTRVHERHVALHREGTQVGVLVFEYSLIAFFHWYVGGEAR